MAKLRHLALMVEDPEATAKFFEQAFGMERTGSGKRVCRLTDGTISVALMLKETDDEKVGIDHFGMWVDDLDAAAERATDAGARVMRFEEPGDDRFYEAKFETPDGIGFDLSHTGWPGAIR